jgi:FKBP-type peptidyl-prolyl cis-trans isomerase 2
MPMPKRYMMERASGAMSLLTLFVILLIIVGVATAGLLIITYQAPEKAVYVTDGDNVKVNYIGMFENGKVFDTSLQDVAGDNATYPKSLSFEYRSTGYDPLEFTVGAGQMIQGFDEGVLGMRVNEVKTVTIPQEKGYGESDSSLIKTRQLTQELPLTEYINSTEFEERYNIEPVELQTVTDSFWGWNVSVFKVDGDLVTIVNQPTAGMVITPYIGWESQVILIDSGTNTIKVRHLLDVNDENNIKSYDADGEFILIDVDTDQGTYTVDYNSEVVGKTLVFWIKIVEIQKPE